MIKRFGSPSRPRDRRRGAVLPMVAALTVVIIGMAAFAIDLGYISLVKGQMQSAADSAALASASQLMDRGALSGGSQTATTIALADAQARRFASANKAGNVTLNLGSTDVAYGYILHPDDPASPFDGTRTPYNSAQVTVQRTPVQNGVLNLFFGPIFDRDEVGLTATATATLEGNIGGFEFNENIPNQKCLLLPFSLDVNYWDDSIGAGIDEWAYDPETEQCMPGCDGICEIKLFPTKNLAPGNFGTIDIGSASNSSDVTTRQILDGPTQADLDLHGGSLEIGADGYLVLNGDTGISAGFKEELNQIKGQPRIIPLHSSVNGTGDNAQFTIVRFVGCVILDVKLNGTQKYMTIQPEYVVDSTATGGGPVSGNSFVFKPLQLTR